ncbi:MAG: protein kinase [Planctomycetes bacterium]|nr:protein kinase [Planctomycetota bacterium]
MHDSWAISRLVSQIKENWRQGDAVPDASAALEANPHLRRWKSIVLDLAAEEYHLRAEVGQQVDADDFCRRFPDYQRSLLHRLEVEQFLRSEEEQQARLWPEPGDVFLGCRLVEPLGRGAVGRVFLAQQIELRDRLVVVKITPRGRHEADTLAILNHPYIVPVYDYKEDAETGLAAIVMPFLSRATLEDFLASAQSRRSFRAILEEMWRRFPMDDLSTVAADGGAQPIPNSFVDAVLNLGRQMAEALAHTHCRSVLHLDLKPSNVLLLPDGRPMLLDFNLSLEGPIGASVIGGTLPYMSPEQLQEAVLGRSYRSRPVDGRSDIFSLGVMLYELLTGTHPFGEIPRGRDSRKAAKELLRRHEAGPASLLEHDPRLDKHVALFLESCLAFHPDQRPATAEDAAEAFRRFLAPRGKAARWRRAHRRSIATPAGLVLLGAAWATAPSAHERHFRAAQTSLAAGDWESAERRLLQAMETRRDDAKVWESLGVAHREQGEFDKAAESLFRAWELTNDARLLAEIGHCWRQAKNFQVAAMWHRKALEEGFESAALFLDLGDISRAQGRFAEARPYYDRAVEQSPSVETWHARARNEVQWAMTSKQPPRSEVLADIRNATEKSETRDILLCAAILHALAEPTGENDAAVRRYSREAVGHGWNPQNLASHVFQRFHNEPWFLKLQDE